MALKYTALWQLGVLLWIIAMKTAASQALPNCKDKCGNMSIPYPFGTTGGCYRDSRFLISCNESVNPPQAFIGDDLISNIDISNISIPDGEVHSTAFVAKKCYINGHKDPGDWYNSEFNLPEIYTFSNKRNKFTVVGCDSYAYISGKGDTYNSGCISLCNDQESVTHDSCSGIGCCQTAIPKGLQNFVLKPYSFNNHTQVWDFNPCTYAFLVEEKSYNFSTPDLSNLQQISALPVVLDWVIDNITCPEAEQNLTSFACKQNSYCINSDNSVGYRCKCSDGFDGNPYLEDGCIDVNECEGPNDCKDSSKCHNVIGSYNCSCPAGYKGDGRIDGQGCSLTIFKYYNEKPLLIKVTIGVGVPVFALLVIGLWLYWRMKERNLKFKQKHFEQNGGLLLQKKLGGSSRDETAKIFTMEELKKATNGFDDKRIIGKGGFGTVYKGVLPKNKIVAIKKSKVADPIQSEQFANEFIILSNINHPNVVKLLGCCLETEVPLLVYEFIENGTLSRQIHNGGHASLPWGTRLRVASETAGALAHLHSAASPPIIHRDVKSTNILLDKNYIAKVSDFGDSRLIPVGETQLDTIVKGTIGYLDPEYLQTGQLTEKSDVYSFGVVLVELLTGLSAISSDNNGEKRYSVQYFFSSLKQNKLFQILDVRVANEGSAEQIREVAKIAENCLSLNGEDRPMMKEVAMELKGLRMVEQHQFTQFELNVDETKRLLVSESMDFGSTSASVEFDSLMNQGISPFDIDGGR